MSKEELLKPSILAQFNDGNQQAFRKVFDCFYQAVFYFARKLLGNKEEAEEITLEAFQKLFERHNKFATVSNIKAFLFITTRNLCLNFIRSIQNNHGKYKEFVQKMEDDHKLMLENDTELAIMDMLATAINNLPEACQRIFRLLYFEGFKPAEVAEKLQISVDNVYNQRKRAIQLLRISLKNMS